MSGCARCDRSACGVYRYELPQSAARTEPLCRGCSGQLRSTHIAEIEKVRSIEAEVVAE